MVRKRRVRRKGSDLAVACDFKDLLELDAQLATLEELIRLRLAQ